MAGRRISSLPVVGTLSAGATVEVAQDGASFRAPIAKIARKRLTADATFYVRTNGNDDNDGLSNDAQGAKRTHQGAIDMLMRAYDLNGCSVTIETGNNGVHTYPGFNVVGKFVGDNGSNMVHVRGNTLDPDSVVITGSSDDALYMEDARLKVSGITFGTTGASGRAWLIRRNSHLVQDTCRLEDCVNESILTAEGSYLASAGPLEVVGDSTSFIHATGNSRVSFESTTVTFTGNPVFTPYVIGINNSWVSFASGTVVGSKQGQTLVHVSGILNLASMTGKIFGDNSPPLASAGGMIISPDVHSTVYVRQDGSDNNDGYYNTASGAFATIQGAINYLAARAFDQNNGKTFTIKVGPGTWTSAVALKNIPNADEVVLEGDTAVPANVILSTSGNCISGVNVRVPWRIKGFAMTSSGGALINVANGTRVFVQDCAFSTAVTGHIVVGRGCHVVNTGNYRIIGGAVHHIYNVGGQVQLAGIVTISNTPAFTSFVRAEDLAMCLLTPTWSGSATGSRYDIKSNSVIDVAGAGTSALPGSSAGSVASGGQYV